MTIEPTDVGGITASNSARSPANAAADAASASPLKSGYATGNGAMWTPGRSGS